MIAVLLAACDEPSPILDRDSVCAGEWGALEGAPAAESVSAAMDCTLDNNPDSFEPADCAVLSFSWTDTAGEVHDVGPRRLSAYLALGYLPHDDVEPQLTFDFDGRAGVDGIDDGWPSLEVLLPMSAYVPGAVAIGHQEPELDCVHDFTCASVRLSLIGDDLEAAYDLGYSAGGVVTIDAAGGPFGERVAVHVDDVPMGHVGGGTTQFVCDDGKVWYFPD